MEYWGGDKSCVVIIKDNPMGYNFPTRFLHNNQMARQDRPKHKVMRKRHRKLIRLLNAHPRELGSRNPGSRTNTASRWTLRSFVYRIGNEFAGIGIDQLFVTIPSPQPSILCLARMSPPTTTFFSGRSSTSFLALVINVPLLIISLHWDS